MTVGEIRPPALPGFRLLVGLSQPQSFCTRSQGWGLTTYSATDHCLPSCREQLLEPAGNVRHLWHRYLFQMHRIGLTWIDYDRFHRMPSLSWFHHKHARLVLDGHKQHDRPERIWHASGNRQFDQGKGVGIDALVPPTPPPSPCLRTSMIWSCWALIRYNRHIAPISAGASFSRDEAGIASVLFWKCTSRTADMTNYPAFRVIAQKCDWWSG